MTKKKMTFTMEIPLEVGTTLADVIEALSQSKEGLEDGGQPLEPGDSGFATVTTNMMGRWHVS